MLILRTEKDHYLEIIKIRNIKNEINLKLRENQN